MNVAMSWKPLIPVVAAIPRKIRHQEYAAICRIDILFAPVNERPNYRHVHAKPSSHFVGLMQYLGFL